MFLSFFFFSQKVQKKKKTTWHKLKKKKNDKNKKNYGKNETYLGGRIVTSHLLHRHHLHPYDDQPPIVVHPVHHSFVVAHQQNDDRHANDDSN